MTLLNPENYLFSAASLPPFLTACLLSILCLTLVVREKLSQASLMFTLLILSNMIWLISQAGAYASRDEETALLWIKIENAGIVFIPSALYLFTLSVTQKLRTYRISAFVSLMISYFFLGDVLFGSWTLKGLYEYPWGYYGRYGPGAFAFIGFFLVFGVRVVRLFWEEYRRSRSHARKGKYRLLTEACILALLGSIDFLPAFGVQFYPFGFIFVILFVLVIVKLMWEYALSEITPATAAKEIIYTMREGLLVADREGTVRIVNSSACRMLGRTAKKISGFPVWNISDGIVTEKKFHAILEGRAAQGYEIVLNEGTGKEIFLNVTTSAVRDATDAPEAIVFMVRDVTEERLAQRLLEQANNELEIRVRQRTEELENANERLLKMDEQKTKFLALASHELRTPLTSIHGFLSLLLAEKTGALTDPQKRSLSAMKKSTDRLCRLVADLLDMSKIELGQLKMNMALTDPGELVEEELLVMETSLKQKEHALVKNIEANLPPIFCDRDKIKEVVENLVSNAVKYTPRGGNVVVEVKSVTGGVGISIRDNGIGIRNDDQKLLFEPFQHLRKAGLEGEVSTGLGLALVKSIVAAHGGNITLESREGQGSCFSVFLPGARSAADAAR